MPSWVPPPGWLLKLPGAGKSKGLAVNDSIVVYIGPILKATCLYVFAGEGLLGPLLGVQWDPAVVCGLGGG